MTTEETKYAEISISVSPDTGEVTLCVRNESWSPIVTGKNLAEAKVKMEEAFGLAMIANSYCATINHRQEESTMKGAVEKMKRLKNTLEIAL